MDRKILALVFLAIAFFMLCIAIRDFGDVDIGTTLMWLLGWLLLNVYSMQLYWKEDKK